jgi:hypothetical protein
MFRRASGQRVILIDTPGFDDTHNDNVQVLQKIVTYLCTIYDSGCLSLSGLIYAQRITDPRMSGSSLKSLRIFEKLCGEKNFANVMIVTTMWDVLKTEEARENAKERQTMLKDTSDFFGHLVNGGAIMTEYDDTYDGALDIVETISGRKQRLVLDVQREMLNKGTLADTTVGQFLSGESQRTRERYERELVKLQNELEDAIADQDDDAITTLSDQKREYEEQIRQSELEQSSLSITVEQMTQYQSGLCVRKYYQEHEREMKVEEKTAREIDLEEQLERTEMDYMRELNALRREKMGQEELIQKQTAEYSRLKDQWESQLGRERAEREAKNQDSNAAKTIERDYFNTMHDPQRAVNKISTLNCRRNDPLLQEPTSRSCRRNAKSGSSRFRQSSAYPNRHERDHPNYRTIDYSVDSHNRDSSHQDTRYRDPGYGSGSEQFLVMQPQHTTTISSQSHSLAGVLRSASLPVNSAPSVFTTSSLGLMSTFSTSKYIALPRSYKEGQ